MEGIRYYWRAFVETGCIGIGMVSSVRMADSTVGIGMVDYGYNPVDQGIFSVIMQFGFQALFLTVWICYRIFRDLNYVRKYGFLEFKIIAIAIQMLLLFKIVTFSHIFFRGSESLWWGIFFFFTWKLRNITESLKTKGLVL